MKAESGKAIIVESAETPNQETQILQHYQTCSTQTVHEFSPDRRCCNTEQCNKKLTNILDAM